MNSWKENNIDPEPAQYNYPLTNFKSNQDDDIIDDYYFYLNFHTIQKYFLNKML